MGLLEGWVELGGTAGLNVGGMVTRRWDLEDLRRVLGDNRAVVVRVDRNRDKDRTPEHFVVVVMCGTNDDIVWAYDPADENRTGEPETFGSLSERLTITHKYVTKRLR